MRLLLCYLWAVVLAEPLLAAENPLFDELLQQGVPLDKTTRVKLPEPTLPDGLSTAEQRKRIEMVADKNYAWDDLTRKAVVAPFILKIVQTEGQGQLESRVDCWFVVHATLDKAKNDDFLGSQAKVAAKENDNAPVTTTLTTAELQERNLAVPDQPEDPRYVAAEARLLDKVHVNATTRSIRTSSADSVIAASLLDPQFADDAKYPNRWRSITKDAAGKSKLGEPQTFTGLGSYVKATRLEQPAGALFVEYHLVYAEPKGWFNGTNLLRAKIPIIVQDSVRKARRNLDKP